MKGDKYRKLLLIPEIQPTDPPELITLYTKQNVSVAIHYSRIVIGGRGPYVEIPNDRIILFNIHIPEYQKWRLNKYWKDKIYYIEWRTIDGIMVYEQLKTVKYADYKIGYFYVSPWDLTSKQYPKLIDGEKLKGHK